tara:strand:+ start:2347 stop:3417 length:1071 start_codon:yes stop_codon:yes gene_type:complete
MNKSIFSLFIFISVFLISCSSGGDDDSAIAVPQESFGDWSPEFSDQTSSFTQTRTGSLGTQQSRSISVNSQSSVSTTTEEILNQDINSDQDFYDEIEKVVTTYSASNGLGSFQLETLSVTDDNNMGIKVGNNFYPLASGSLVIYKTKGEIGGSSTATDVECEINGVNYSLYEVNLNLWSEGISVSPNAENPWSGEGAMFYTTLFSIIDNDIALNDNKQISYFDFFDIYNGATGTSYNSQNASDNCVSWEIDDPLWDAFDDTINTHCEYFNLYYNTSQYRYYDTNFDTNYANNDGGADEDYCLGTQFDHTGKVIKVSKNSDDIYTIKIEGKDRYSLPLKIFYKGYLAIKIGGSITLY